MYILWNSLEHLFYRTPPNDYFWQEKLISPGNVSDLVTRLSAKELFVRINHSISKLV